tara:strand:- start:2783 stop:3925 length:1143 start_codon:yes stop_codon:yes gene_type:complete
MALSKDQIRTVDGKIFLIPAGTETVGAKSASVSEIYAVTMSGASLSQSILCPHSGSSAASSSYFYFSTTDKHSILVWYANDKNTTLQPRTDFSSSIRVNLNIGEEGNTIAYKTVKGIDNHKARANRYIVSSSGIFKTSGSNGFDYYEDAKMFITHTITGETPPDAFNVTYISGSSFNYNLVQEGSGSAYGTATEGIAPTSSASTVIDGTGGYDGIINTAEYKNLGITAENSASFLTPFTAVGKTYYNLDLSTQGAVFVRIDTNLLYPIGKITPRDPVYNKAQMLYIEAGNNGPHYLASPQVAGVVITEINVDAGDLIQDSFHPRTIRGNYYPEAFEFDLGCRVMLIRGAHDWKVQSLSDFSNTTASFDNISFSSINGGTF